MKFENVEDLALRTALIAEFEAEMKTKEAEFKAERNAAVNKVLELYGAKQLSAKDEFEAHLTSVKGDYEKNLAAQNEKIAQLESGILERDTNLKKRDILANVDTANLNPVSKLLFETHILPNELMKAELKDGKYVIDGKPVADYLKTHDVYKEMFATQPTVTAPPANTHVPQSAPQFDLTKAKNLKGSDRIKYVEEYTATLGLPNDEAFRKSTELIKQINT
jgi:hypothetical protein